MGAVLEGIFTVPGDGVVPFENLLTILAKADYSGWLVVEAEQDPAKAHPMTYATMGYRNLKSMADAPACTSSFRPAVSGGRPVPSLVHRSDSDRQANVRRSTFARAHSTSRGSRGRHVA